jgi:predicted nuclease of predicted toxin-antitoxin system
MRFIADINVSRRIVEELCDAGHDAVHVSVLMDCRAKDKQILEEGRRRNAVVVSHDQDFAAILATTGALTPSLINIRVSYVDVDRLARMILSVVQATAQDLSTGAIVTIDDRGVRIHQLPVR